MLYFVILLKLKNNSCNNWYKTLSSSWTLSNQGNTELFEQWQSGFKRTINWYKYQCRTKIQDQDLYFDYLSDSCLCHGLKIMPTEQVIKDTFFQLYK